MASPAKADAVGKGQEPSMEEILASIRKIISDDDTKTTAKAPAPVEESPAGQDDIDALMASLEAEPAVAVAQPKPSAAAPASPPLEVLELTEDMAAEVDFMEEMEMESEPVAPAPKARPAMEPRAAMPDFEPEVPPARSSPSSDNRLLSSGADAAIAQAFGSLTHTILSQNARTLDDLVQDMLRPMLKQWLDDNLPSLVERLVRSEIERVSRGR